MINALGGLQKENKFLAMRFPLLLLLFFALCVIVVTRHQVAKLTAIVVDGQLWGKDVIA